MPTFRHKNRPEDWTYEFESNPDPEHWVEVKADDKKAAPARSSSPVKADEAEATETKES